MADVAGDEVAPSDFPKTKWEWEKAFLARSRSEGMNPTTQHIALVLSVYARKSGENIFPSRSTIQSVTGRSRETVRASLKELRTSGWVTQVSRGSQMSGKASVYRLSIPKGRGGDL